MRIIFELLIATSLFCGCFGRRAFAAVEYNLVAATGANAAAKGYGPNLGPGVYFDQFMTTPVLNSHGEVAFRAAIAGDGVDASNDVGIWSTVGGALSVVAREGAEGPGPGLGEGVEFSASSSISGFYNDPVLDDSGRLAFVASLRGPGVDSTNAYGIWVSDGGTPSLVMRSGGPVAINGLQEEVSLSVPALPVLSGDTIAFTPKATGSGVDATNESLLLAEVAGELVAVVRSGPDGPGFPSVSGEYFASLSSPYLNGMGDIVFTASLAGEGIDSSNNLGVYQAHQTSITEAAREGRDDSLGPNLGPGVVFSGSLAATGTNNYGDIAMTGRVTGPGITSSNDSGIWVHHDGTTLPVIREGDIIPYKSGLSLSGPLYSTMNAAGDIATVATFVGEGITNGIAVVTAIAGDLNPVAIKAVDDQFGPGLGPGVMFHEFGRPLMNAAGDVAFRARWRQDIRYSSITTDGVWATHEGVLQKVVSIGDLIDLDPSTDEDWREVLRIDYFNTQSSGGEDGNKRHFNDDGLLVFSVIVTGGDMAVFTAKLDSNPQIPGDFNLDQVADGHDFLAWQRVEHPFFFHSEKLQFWRDSYGESAANAASPALIPEPTGSCLALVPVVLTILIQCVNYGRSRSIARRTGPENL